MDIWGTGCASSIELPLRLLYLKVSKSSAVELESVTRLYQDIEHTWPHDCALVNAKLFMSLLSNNYVLSFRCCTTLTVVYEMLWTACCRCNSILSIRCEMQFTVNRANST